MRSDTQEGKVCVANSSCCSRLILQDSQCFIPAHLLPELRGEWVRKGIGWIEIEKIEKGKSA